MSLLAAFVASGTAVAGPNTWVDFSATSLGLQSTYVPRLPEETELDEDPLPRADHNVLLGQRLRWTLIDGDDWTGLALADMRFTVDPQGQTTLDTFERNRVRQLGLELRSERWTLDVGRHAVYRGGPRLVDGLQVLFRTSDPLELGMWMGLAPDLFTTRGRIRPGGGPILAYTKSRASFSVVGELLSSEGEFDRAAVLAQGRVAADRILEVSGRFDMQVAGDEGSFLSDALLLGIWQPTADLRLDLYYNGFSSLRYQSSNLLDPEIQRFENRMDRLALDFGVTQDQLDATMNHLVGANARWQPATDGGATAPRLEFRMRARQHPNPLDRYTLINPRAGLVDLPLAGRLEVIADANLITANTSFSANSGVTLFWELGDEGVVALDSSIRALLAPEPDIVGPGDALRYFDGVGWYADFFVDWVMPIEAILVAGVSYEVTPDPTIGGDPDAGVGVFLQVTKYFRR